MKKYLTFKNKFRGTVSSKLAWFSTAKIFFFYVEESYTYIVLLGTCHTVWVLVVDCVLVGYQQCSQLISMLLQTLLNISNFSPVERCCHLNLVDLEVPPSGPLWAFLWLLSQSRGIPGKLRSYSAQLLTRKGEGFTIGKNAATVETPGTLSHTNGMGEVT